MTDSWWNTSYSIRRSLEIINTSTDPIPADNAIYLVLDFSKMNALNKVKDDFEDIEILFWDYGLATPAWTVLPRATSYDSSTGELIVLFNTVYEIATQDILNYYIYYTNPSLKDQVDRPGFAYSTYAQTATPQNGGIMFSRPTEDWLGGTSLKVNARAAFVFYGSNIGIVFNKGNNKGIVEVSIDGGFFQNIDTYSNIDEEYLYELELTVGKHYVRFRVTGDKNPSSSDSIIEIVQINYSRYLNATQGVEQIFSLNNAFTIVTGV